MLLKRLSRRDILVGAGKLAVGTVGIAAVSSEVLNLLPRVDAKEIPTKAEANGEPKYPWPWPYKKLDPAKVARRAYEEWFENFCSQATLHGLITALREEVGEPYISFPVGAFRFGHGGVMGHGTLCGTILASAITIGLVAGKEPGERMILDVIGYYSHTELPIYKPERIHEKGAEIKNRSKSGTPLCHISVGRWMRKEGVLFDDPRRKERCARLSADLAAKTAEILNKWVDTKEYNPIYEPQLKVQKIPFRKDLKITGQENCSDCHNPFKVAFNAVKNRIIGAPGGEYKK